MNSNYYTIFVAKSTDLAASIIIKSTDTVDGLNRYVNDQSLLTGSQPVNDLDKTTWKYYLNISGSYHPIDPVISVVSLDTLETIAFTKENLAIHSATALAYGYGSRYYKVLVSQYPDHELLIRGILYPVDMQKAIAAIDGTILGYPPSLVETNEYSLISKLQKWIHNFKGRWVNVQYGVSDALYPATALGIMYLNLLPAILTIRLEACRTNEAHSFHIRQYLVSHNLLNSYIDNMTLPQTLFFYRNIAYIERNAGKQSIFNWLVYNVLTVRNLPLAKYTMQHDLTNQPDDLYPNILFYKELLNKPYSTKSATILPLQEVLANENPLAVSNAKYVADYIASTKEKMENSLSSFLATKTLESSVIDDTNSEPYSLADILLNHWISLADSGNYVSYININNPKTNSDVILSVKDSFILAWYVFCKSINVDVVEIPSMLATRVQRIMPTTTSNPSSVVSVSEIMSVVDTSLVSIDTAKQALSLQPNITTIISTNAFYQLCSQIYTAAQMQRNLVAQQQLSVQRAMVMGMVSRIYSDNMCQLAPAGTLYSDWLRQRNLDLVNLTADEMNKFYTDIVNTVTGSNLYSNNSLRNIQDAMINIMTQLSSYNIQYIKTINNSAENKTDWTLVRVASINNLSTEEFHVLDLGAGVMSVANKENNAWLYPLDNSGFVNQISNTVHLGVNNLNSAPALTLFGQPITKIELHLDTACDVKVTVLEGDDTSNNLDVYGFKAKDYVNPVNKVDQLLYSNDNVVTGATVDVTATAGITVGGFDTGLNVKT